MNTLVIDGYNVIHRLPAFRRFLEVSLERAREELIQLVRAYVARRKVSAVVVFDGQAGLAAPDWPANGRLRVLFSRPPRDADAVIRDLVTRAENRKALTVVTDDVEIIRFAAANQVPSLSTSVFYDRLNQRPATTEVDGKYDSPLSPDELDDWLQLFGEK